MVPTIFRSLCCSCIPDRVREFTGFACFNAMIGDDPAGLIRLRNIRSRYGETEPHVLRQCPSVTRIPFPERTVLACRKMRLNPKLAETEDRGQFDTAYFV